MRVLIAAIMMLSFVPSFAADIRLPEGFSIDIYAENIHGARSMTLGDGGTVFVGTRVNGNVYAVWDADGDGRAEERRIIASGLNSPNGVAFRDGALYVAEISKVLRFDNIENNLDKPGKPVAVYDELPAEGWHGWKYIAFGPDGRLYIPVGAPCNICVRELPYASLHSMNPDGSGFRTEAVGIRNTVGFDWNPVSGSLWFTDNGRDMLGDDIPPDELNRITARGDNFGFPYCYGDGTSDPEFGDGKECGVYKKPEVKFQAHVAPLGMKFYTGEMFPEKYRNGIFVAQHGSWNRSKKVGYRVVFINVKGDRAVSSEPFAEGWLDGGDVSGRPVDILVLKDGSILISDDRNGRIYRVSFKRR